MISSVHCRLRFHARYAAATDMNATNGICLNPGQPVTVRNGATICLANSACAFRIYVN